MKRIRPLVLVVAAFIANTPAGPVQAGTPWPDDGDARTAAPRTRGVDGPVRPDVVGDHTGGIAARIHENARTPVPGALFILMAVPGSTTSAHVFDETAFAHANGTRPDSWESNVDAAALVSGLTGHRVEPVDLTNAPGGGASGGLTYALAYLLSLTDGGFGGGLRIAATGTLIDDGYLTSVTALDEKVAAAHLAGVDVVFVPGSPRRSTRGAFAARVVGDPSPVEESDAPLGEQRPWSRYESLGADRPDGMDLVVVRHVGDVAAYLCGAGSSEACELSSRWAERPAAGVAVRTVPTCAAAEGAPRHADLPLYGAR